ncbi:hypothetical protein Godav_024958, partial [Gossypium davidsonii]|nr:hypothetical protein [Gossypium davidsonii]
MTHSFQTLVLRCQFQQVVVLALQEQTHVL